MGVGVIWEKGKLAALFSETLKRRKPKEARFLWLFCNYDYESREYNHVSSKLSWRILSSQHAVLEEKTVTLNSLHVYI